MLGHTEPERSGRGAALPALRRAPQSYGGHLGGGQGALLPSSGHSYQRTQSENENEQFTNHAQTSWA